MNYKTFLLLFLLAVFLTACASGPPNDLVEERIYQIYIYEAKVQGKVQCEVPKGLAGLGYEEIWMVAVKKGESEQVSEVFFSLQNGEWEIVVGMRIDC